MVTDLPTGLRLVFLAMVVSIAGLLAGCGGGSQASPPAPMFASTPATAATEGSAYTYQITASDPAGGPVSLALTNAPAGATLSGSTITWTPTPAQSRVGNSFTVTATTLAGSTATQSWSVTPNGTVHLSWVDTLWTASGPQSAPVDWTKVGLADSPRALVPQPDGSLLALGGAGNGDGIFNIPNVPAGYYWLQITPFYSYWTSSSTFDFGTDLIGRNLQLSGTITATTTINLCIGGLDSSQAGDWFGFATDSQNTPFEDKRFSSIIPPPPNSQCSPGPTTLLYQTDNLVDLDIDLSQMKTIFVGQYERFSLSSFDALVLGPELTLSDVTLTNGVVNNLNVTLNPSPKASLAVSIKGSEWANLFNNVAPAPVTPVGSVLTVSAQPFVTDRNVPFPELSVLGPNVPLVTPDLDALGGISVDSISCEEGPWSFYPEYNASYPAPILTDQVLGTVQYGDPFPASWPRVFNFCEKAMVALPMPNSTKTVSFLLGYGQATNLPSSPVSPLVSSVQNPLINGSSFFKAQTIDSAPVILSWSPPPGTAPYGYYVQVLVPDLFGYVPKMWVGTAKTSMTLPMAFLPFVPPGKSTSVVLLITAEVDGRANMETSPFRSALPTAYASVISAPITISSSASPQVIHGDAEGVSLTPLPATNRARPRHLDARRIR